jgi:GTP-binding protein HflX
LSPRFSPGKEGAVSFDKTREELSVRLERAVLVAVALPERPFPPGDPLEELRGLAETAGAKVVDELTQKRHEVQLGTYIGTGKLKELVERCESHDADVIIFDNDLTPSQIRALEQATKCKVLDRSELILDIFATRARTAESRLQVELAQLEYALPRLRRMWSHLSRLEGGIGMRGPGETQLEEDRRLVDHRIRELKSRLTQVQARKEREVESRAGEMTVSLVGYTNAGKSTLMNRLTGAGVLAEDRLFSTLDTRTRQWKLGERGKVLLSDTVGFIRDLPHHLVASFKATLEEARRASLLLHVVDASDTHAEERIEAVRKVLDELGCGGQPTLIVFNKIDGLPDVSYLQVLQTRHPRSVAVSARTGEGIQSLEDAVSAELARGLERFDIIVDAANGKAMAYAEAHAEISSKELVGVTMRLKGLASSEDVAKLRRLGARPADQVEPGALGDF